MYKGVQFTTGNDLLPVGETCPVFIGVRGGFDEVIQYNKRTGDIVESKIEDRIF